MPHIYHMSYLQAIGIGFIQGIGELFPISSLGHTVLIPSWLGGSWATLVSQESMSESPYLAFVVGLHLAPRPSCSSASTCASGHASSPALPVRLPQGASPATISGSPG